MDDYPAGIERDTALEERMLAAVIEDRNSVARNQQRLAGPSSIGFCRELLRHTLFEGGTAASEQQESHWATAAYVGTVVGEDLERIFGERLDALTQQRITTALSALGLNISGAIDLLFIGENQISDLKSTTDVGGVLYDLNKNAAAIETLLALFRSGELYDHWIETADGRYELTDATLAKMSKLQYYTQLAIYITGAVQAGILDAGAEGRLVFYDRAGDYQGFIALILRAEIIELFFTIAQHRIRQVVEAQALLEEHGDPRMIHYLRDQSPSFCFSPKVMCPLRERCWGGSTWSPEDEISGAEVESSVDRYIEGRRLEKLGKSMREGARAELRGVSGRLPDGRQVSWTGSGGNTINVVETTPRKKETE